MSGVGKSTVWAGLGASVPLILGYFPIAFSFGVAATRSGMSGAEALALSVIMYSGAAQFLAVALIAAGVPVVVAVATLGGMALRHLLYGPALLGRAGQDGAVRWAGVWGFGLTDEVFAAGLGEMARGRRFSEPLMLGLAAGAYGAWLSGTLVGAYAGGGALEAWPAVSAGLGFMLPALFLALLLSMLTRAQVPVIMVAAAVTVAVTLAWSGTAGLLTGMLAGALAGVLGLGSRHAG
jgi:predicted branched-subunit amino acid permease